ncbi:hypothetical protein HMPREF0454_02754 [Hafnia alvei ATCC 51873]|uniref:Uncharacterized protein n=1 Tax=Hafnia alvei ATCC 51873 TaxID=1002364 RepID=G9Y845_HAFAL|nr:hypothetical protein HMPREF0454_02754 [Hafnia alvei ATCC 51873]
MGVGLNNDLLNISCRLKTNKIKRLTKKICGEKHHASNTYQTERF